MKIEVFEKIFKFTYENLNGKFIFLITLIAYLPFFKNILGNLSKFRENLGKHFRKFKNMHLDGGSGSNPLKLANF